MFGTITGRLATHPGSFPILNLHWSGYVEEWLNNSSSIDVEDKVSEYLRKFRQKNSLEILGPTQSKLNIFYGKSKIHSDYCSTGQQKFILVSMVLAFSKLLSDRKKIPPILLLDEVSSHLDNKSFQAFFDASIENSIDLVAEEGIVSFKTELPCPLQAAMNSFSII